ncbi:hypothetical protein QNH14_10050 [Apirhabdus apintestini]|nr:hypothetical protein QNH14_10050 [Enterobacteriaceae bacterium CA-0114]
MPVQAGIHDITPPHQNAGFIAPRYALIGHGEVWSIDKSLNGMTHLPIYGYGHEKPALIMFLKQ